MLEERRSGPQREETPVSAHEEERLSQEVGAALNLLRAYLRRTLDEPSFTALLADLTHARIRMQAASKLPEKLARAFQVLEAGLEQALKELKKGAQGPGC
jgi:hypothetical protein